MNSFWQARTAREKILLIFSLVFFIASISYKAIYLPIDAKKKQAQSSLRANLQFIHWYNSRAQQIAYTLVSKKRQNSGVALTTAACSNLLIKNKLDKYVKLHEQNAKQLKLQLRAAPFAQVMLFLQDCDQHNYVIQQLSMQKTTDPGIVNVQLVVS